MELLKTSKKTLRNVSKLFKAKWKQRNEKLWTVTNEIEIGDNLKGNVERKKNENNPEPNNEMERENHILKEREANLQK
jgi:hypothetical protein